MKKYHVKSGDGKGYYGVGYESYRQAENLLKISQEHDPQAHIIEEEYHFTNADSIRAMSDEELAYWLGEHLDCNNCPVDLSCVLNNGCPGSLVDWLKQHAEE